MFLCSTAQQFDRITELCHRKFSFSGKNRENHNRVFFAKYLFSRPIYFFGGKKGKSLCCSLPLSQREGDIDFFRSSSVYRVPIDHRLLLLPILPPPPLPPHTTFSSSSSSSPKVSRVETHFFSFAPAGLTTTRKGGGEKNSTTSLYYWDTSGSDQPERAAEYLAKKRGASSVEFFLS